MSGQSAYLCFHPVDELRGTPHTPLTQWEHLATTHHARNSRDLRQRERGLDQLLLYTSTADSCTN
jgi:hypothetical protein